MNPVYVTFALYLVMMIIIGALCCRKSNSTIDDFLLGGRGLGSWVTAFSAQASDMSGWLLMGLPGAIYVAGSGDMWVAIGLLIGTVVNWLIVAPRLRLYTEKNKALTLSSFFAERFRDPSGLLRIVSAIVVVVFFSIYAGSGLVATGKLFNSMFGMSYKTAVVIGAVVLLVYTLLGGYLAVCWTDLFQGALMFIALIAVPLTALFVKPEVMDLSKAGGISLFPGGFSTTTLVAAISGAVWGLGYFGQPHILSRFMSIKSVKLLPRATVIASIWVVISLAAAVFIGLIGRTMFPGLSAGESEKVFIKMIDAVCWPWLGGLFLAAILAAIMSTIDSQLLVLSSTLTSDFYSRYLRKEASAGELVWISRIFVALITVVACIMALAPSKTIFDIVKFAWGGFGAAFGPVVIMALYSRRTTWISALAGMVTGTVVMMVWYAMGWNSFMYEILPGFIANFIAINLVNIFVKQTNAEITGEFDSVKAELNSKE